MIALNVLVLRLLICGIWMGSAKAIDEMR
jgi:hypothetical protein